MPYIAPEVITEAKRMDLLTYDCGQKYAGAERGS